MCPAFLFPSWPAGNRLPNLANRTILADEELKAEGK
jgi:hypothetical protein